MQASSPKQDSFQRTQSEFSISKKAPPPVPRALSPPPKTAPPAPRTLSPPKAVPPPVPVQLPPAKPEPQVPSREALEEQVCISSVCR